MNSADHTRDQLVSYILGELTTEQERDFESLTSNGAILGNELFELRMSLEIMALNGAVAPSTATRSSILAAMEAAIKEEEQLGRPPVMHAHSTPVDFKAWIEKPEHVLPAGADTFHLIDLDLSADRQTGLVWLKEGYPAEVHTDCVERILILEGSCNVHFSDSVVPLSSGDVITIPMYAKHSVEVTGTCWCKALVQRVAA
ncbi:MAG: cupin domain-containing protein [Flavobacteriales bacterium]